MNQLLAIELSQLFLLLLFPILPFFSAWYCYKQALKLNRNKYLWCIIGFSLSFFSIILIKFINPKLRARKKSLKKLKDQKISTENIEELKRTSKKTRNEEIDKNYKVIQGFLMTLFILCIIYALIDKLT
jgi:hypothetical protein